MCYTAKTEVHAMLFFSSQFGQKIRKCSLHTGVPHFRHANLVLFRCNGPRGGSRRAIGAIAPPKTKESNFIHHDFLLFGKQHSRYKAILSSIVLSQHFCEVNFIPLTVAKPVWDLTTNYYWNRSPPNITGWIGPWMDRKFGSVFLPSVVHGLGAVIADVK